MPYAMKKLPHKNEYEVINELTGKIHAKHSTKQKAVKQMKLLHMIHNKKLGK